jgi:LAO/AO transport system kinase
MQDAIEVFEQKFKARNLVALSKAFTLNESTLEADNSLVDELIARNKSMLSNGMVISISGIPGVGKSTFIECLGTYLHSLGHKIAVFSIDPSSEQSKGSILGDKTRMENLSLLENVFIRPIPSSNQLGGVGLNTHRNVALAKIAGFDIIIIETVGVGQSETIVRHLSDLFVLLMMPASGDELQGVKKGIMEVADFFIIHKADGILKDKALYAKKEIEAALHYSRSEVDDIVSVFSSIEKDGIMAVWDKIKSLFNAKREKGILENQRLEQYQFWFDYELKQRLYTQFLKKNNKEISELEEKIRDDFYLKRIDIDTIINKK